MDPHTHIVQYTYLPLLALLFALLLTGIIRHCLRTMRLTANPFVITPVLQLGPTGGDSTDMEIRWLTADNLSSYRLILKALAPAGLSEDQQTRIIETHPCVLKIHSSSDVAVDMPRIYWCYVAPLENLPADTAYSYEVWRDNTVIFTDQFRTRKAPDQPIRFIARGDVGTKGDSQQLIADRILLENPDFLLDLGDVVYKQGLFSEYLTNFFPFQRRLLSRFLTALMLGNHDVARPDFRKGHTLSEYTDSLAWYYVWSMPLNGPRQSSRLSNVEPLLGEKHLRRTFMRNAQDRYPVMGNYSFDYGMVHFVVLDANVYMNWNDSAFRQWLRDDLKRSTARWKIVAWHQPSFTSHLRHRVEQRMRLVAGIIQDAGVKLVLTGHAHHYERSYPLNFQIAPGADLVANGRIGDVDGVIELDKDFDGVTNTKPRGTIYVVSGAGGAPLSIVGRDVPGSSSEWQSFTHKLVFDRNSISLIEATENALTLQQMSADGQVFDSFTIT